MHTYQVKIQKWQTLDKFSLPEQSDYIDMKSIAKKIKTRLQFHPQFHIVDAWGDVRLRVGQRFKRGGAHIPSGKMN